MNPLRNSSSNIFYQLHHSSHYESKSRQYKTIKHLGQGGFASCYQVLRIHDHKRFAMKVIKITTDNEKTKCNKSKQKIKSSSLEKARSQARILSRLNNPHIVKYQADFIEGNEFSIVMEFCENGALADLLKKRRFLSQVQARYYIAQIVQGLIYLKSMNVIHRDLKPANFILDSKMKLKICDFGLAIDADYVIHSPKNLCGTPNYISPQILDKSTDISFQVDIWSIGVILYTMLYGIAPFQTQAKVQEQTFEKIRKCQYNLTNPAVSSEAKDLISRILVVNPKRRIKLQEILKHPFINEFKIPFCLPSQFLQFQPNRTFLCIFQRNVIVCKNSKYDPTESQIFQTKNEHYETDDKLSKKDRKYQSEYIKQKFYSQLVYNTKEGIKRNNQIREVRIKNHLKDTSKQPNQVATASPQSIEHSNRVNAEFPTQKCQKKIEFIQKQVENKREERMDVQTQCINSEIINKPPFYQELSFDIDQYSMKPLAPLNKMSNPTPKYSVANKINTTQIQPISVKNILTPTFYGGNFVVGYLLSSGYIGLLFFDKVSLLIEPKGKNIYFIKQLFVKEEKLHEFKIDNKNIEYLKIEFNPHIQEDQYQVVWDKNKQKILKKQRKQYLDVNKMQKIKMAKKVYKQFLKFLDDSFKQNLKTYNINEEKQQIQFESLKYMTHFKQINHKFYFQMNNKNIYFFKIVTNNNKKWKREFSDIFIKKNITEFETYKTKSINVYGTQIIFIARKNQFIYYQKNKLMSKQNQHMNSVDDNSQNNERKVFNQFYFESFKSQKPLIFLDLLQSLPNQKFTLTSVNSLNDLTENKTRLSKLSSRQLSSVKEDLLWLGIMMKLQNSFFMKRLEKEYLKSHKKDKTKQKTQSQSQSESSIATEIKSCKNSKFLKMIQKQASEMISDVIGIQLL